MKTRSIGLVLLLLVCTASLAGDDIAERLVGRALGATPLMSDLETLCNEIGGRPSGSPQLERAVAWAAEAFKQAGVDSVRLESFEMPRTWRSEKAEATCIAPSSFPLRVVAAPYSVGTPGNAPIEARVVDAGEGSPAAFAALGKTARGAIALVSNPEMHTFDDLFAEYLQAPAIFAEAQKAGVAALLVQSSRPRGLLYRHIAGLNTNLLPLPVAQVAREQAERLRSLMSRTEVRVRLQLVNRIGAPATLHNVVATIRGRELPNETVLLGAHLDSWDLGTGANDNGVNVTMLIDVARGMVQTKARPRRSVQFVLFSGEEEGLLGSYAFTHDHKGELGALRAVAIFDIGSGRTTGFFLGGQREWIPVLDEVLAPVATLAPQTHLSDPIDGTDNFDFFLSGVPNLVANQDAVPYLPDYHAESDTFDKVDAREAHVNTAIASALAWGLAERRDLPLQRQPRSAVEKMIVDYKLESQMRAFGQWEEWVSGERGFDSNAEAVEGVPPAAKP